MIYTLYQGPVVFIILGCTNCTYKYGILLYHWLVIIPRLQYQSSTFNEKAPWSTCVSIYCKLEIKNKKFSQVLEVIYCCLCCYCESIFIGKFCEAMYSQMAKNKTLLPKIPKFQPSMNNNYQNRYLSSTNWAWRELEDSALQVLTFQLILHPKSLIRAIGWVELLCSVLLGDFGYN